MSHCLHRLGLVVSLVVLVPVAAGAQIPNFKKLKELKDKAKEVKKATEGQKPADSTARADSAPTATPKPAAAAPVGVPATPSAKVWENYDFVPGSKMVFFTDFSEDKVGNFARRLKYKRGPAEIVERDGAKVLRATGPSEFLIPLGRKLPARFTLELDVISPQPTDGEHDPHQMLQFEGGAEADGGDQSALVTYMTSLAWIQGGGQSSPASNSKVPEDMVSSLRGNVAHVRVLMDGAYFKMYVNERRLYNIPELAVRRDSAIRVAINTKEEEPVFVTGLRVAESETDVLYDALANKGRWATQGILFETGKADLKPESRPVLKEIAATLTQHTDLKILIEGHTDNVGTPASNLSLSGARAAAVKAALVANYSADGARISTKGFGDTKPALPNTTAEGRAQNRRVEIVKQ